MRKYCWHHASNEERTYRLDHLLAFNLLLALLDLSNELLPSLQLLIPLPKDLLVLKHLFGCLRVDLLAELVEVCSSVPASGTWQNVQPHISDVFSQRFNHNFGQSNTELTTNQ